MGKFGPKTGTQSFQPHFLGPLKNQENYISLEKERSELPENVIYNEIELLNQKLWPSKWNLAYCSQFYQ